MSFLLSFFLAANAGWITGLGGAAETNARGDVIAVDLRGAWVTDADLDRLAAMPTIERIDLSLTRVTDLGLLRLRDLPNVRELNLFFAELVTDEGLACMRNWTRIERLNLRGTKVTDNTLALLAGKESIRALDIGFAEVTDSGLQHLPKLPNLRELAFGGNKMTEIGLEVLRALPNITKLDLAGRQRTDSGLWYVAFTDVGLDPVVTLEQLTDLNLAGSQVSSKGIALLSRLKKLERLNLDAAKRVADDAVPHLAALPALQWVDLKDTAITAKGFAQLRSAKPALDIAGDPAREPIESFKIEMENQSFRVVRVHLEPHERIETIDHPTAAAVVYVYLTDSGPVKFAHEGGAALERPPHRAGALRIARGGKEHHITENAGDKPVEYVRVELNGELKQRLARDTRYEPIAVSTAADTRHVVFENAAFRVLRLSCPSRGNCPANQGSALDITLGSGGASALRPGAAARYNETPLPLELVRIELQN
ncbi:MAG: hypothetical protein R2729_10585 [Bryobacteraceae bacterium]